MRNSKPHISHFFLITASTEQTSSTSSAAPSTSSAEARKLNAQLSSKVRNPSIIPGSFFERDQTFKENSAKGGTKAIVQPLTQGPVEFKFGKFSSWTPAWARIEGASIVLYPPQQLEALPPATTSNTALRNGVSSSSTAAEKQQQQQQQQLELEFEPQGAPLKKFQLVGSHLNTSKSPLEFTISEGAPGGGGGSSGGTSSSGNGNLMRHSSSGNTIAIKAGTAGQRDQWMVAFGRIPGIFRKAEDYYVLGRQWGSGATSEVIEVTGKFTLKKFALKRRLQNTREATTAMHNELRILQICAKHPHPAIPTLEDFFFSTSGRIELVMQLMQGGELFDWIASREEHLTETDAKIVFKQVVSGVAHLHSLGIAHRDLKPQNLMYVTASEGAGEGAMIKIMDYDLARVNYSPEWEGSTPCGTIHYMAPEVIRRDKYSLAIDCWSLGVILYILLSGCMPFSGKNDDQIESAIEKGEYVLTGELWDEVSDEAKDLVKKLLKMDPSERIPAAECLEHPWLKEIDDGVGAGGGGGGLATSPAILIGGQRSSGPLSSPERSLRTVQNLRQLSGSLRGSRSSGGLVGSRVGSAEQQHFLLKKASGVDDDDVSADVENLRLTLDLVGTEAGILDSRVARATGAGQELIRAPGSPVAAATAVVGGGRETDEFADLDAAFVEEEENRVEDEVEEEEN